MESRNTRHVPFRHDLSPFALSSLLSFSFARALSPSAFTLSYFSPPLLYCYRDDTLDSLNVFHEATPKGARTHIREYDTQTGQNSHGDAQWNLSHFRILPLSEELNFLSASALTRHFSLRSSTFTFRANVSAFRTDPERNLTRDLEHDILMVNIVAIKDKYIGNLSLEMDNLFAGKLKIDCRSIANL